MTSQPQLTRTIVKNASSNVLRLAGSGVVALLLPAVLVRMLPQETYGAWVLLLQMSMYVSYLDLGIYTAVARFVAHAEELDNFGQRDSIVSTAFLMLSGAAVLGICGVALLAWYIPAVFPQMPAQLGHSAQFALLMMGCSLAVGLPISVVSAVFAGRQRYEIPAVIAVGNKCVMAILVITVVTQRKGLVLMAAAMAIANLCSYVGTVGAWKAYAATVKIRLRLASMASARHIASYSGTLLVWMSGMLLVSGLDLTIVGAFDYKSTAYYGVAAMLTNFVAQAQGAIFAALLPASAVLGARGDGERLGAMLVASTRYGMLILLAMALPLIVAGHWLLRLWAGFDYAQHATLILQVLVIANVVRLCALPYATLLLGTGQQKKVIASPLAEGITNLITSIVGAYLFGAIGVAFGTLIGAFVSIGLHLFYNMPRTALIVVDRLRLVKEGLLRPSICTLPFLLLLEVRPAGDLSEYVVLLTLATVAGASLFWNFGLLRSERQRVAHVLRLL